MIDLTLKDIATLVPVATVIVALFAVLYRQSRKLSVLSEGIMGKPAVTDYADQVVEKAVPSLQARVGKIEELLINVADTNDRLVKLEVWRTEHEQFSEELVRRLLDMQAGEDKDAS